MASQIYILINNTWLIKLLHIELIYFNAKSYYVCETPIICKNRLSLGNISWMMFHYNSHRLILRQLRLIVISRSTWSAAMLKNDGHWEGTKFERRWPENHFRSNIPGWYDKAFRESLGPIGLFQINPGHSGNYVKVDLIRNGESDLWTLLNFQSTSSTLPCFFSCLILIIRLCTPGFHFSLFLSRIIYYYLREFTNYRRVFAKCFN